MGFEGRKKPPAFVIKAAMAEDPAELRRLASLGGKAAAEKRKKDKQAAEEARKAEDARIAAEREIFEEIDAEAIVDGAKDHEEAFPNVED